MQQAAPLQAANRWPQDAFGARPGWLSSRRTVAKASKGRTKGIRLRTLRGEDEGGFEGFKREDEGGFEGFEGEDEGGFEGFKGEPVSAL